MNGRAAVVLSGLLVLWVLGAACAPAGPRIAAVDLAQRLELPGGNEVAFGKAFELRVVRTWRRDLKPDEFGEQTLLPLLVKLRGVTERNDGDHVEQVRTYDAYSFERERVTVPAMRVTAAAPGGGPDVVAECAALELKVLPARTDANDAQIELPGSMLDEPTGRRLRWLAAVPVVLVLAMWWRSRRPAPKVARPAPATPPDQIAMQQFAALAAAVDLPAERFAVGLSATLRTFVGAVHRVHAVEMTTRELLACGVPGVQGLAELFRTCDLVKFAQLPLGAAERQRLLAAAETFVRGAGRERAA